MKHARNILRFFALLDRANNLSLTNVAVIVCLVKMCVAPAVGFIDAATMLIAFANYAHKRKESTKVECKAVEEIVQVKEEFNKLQEDLTNKMDGVNKLHETLKQQAEETTQNLNAIRLGRVNGR